MNSDQIVVLMLVGASLCILSPVMAIGLLEWSRRMTPDSLNGVRVRFVNEFVLTQGRRARG